MIRILLADDQPSVRRGLAMRLALESDLCIVGEAANAEEALGMAEQLGPDVIVMDAALQKPGDAPAITRLRDAAPQAAVIVLSLHGDGEARQRAHDAGARAFVEKQGSVAALLREIRRAMRSRA
jgi:DNA-binding NarL/FixJ family response regulator